MSGDGSHVLTYWSTDVAGNAEDAHIGYVNIWGMPPATSASDVVAAAADEGWWMSERLSRSASPASGGHGSVTVHYVLDGGERVDAAGEARFEVTGDGSHEIEYWATDELGNEESHRTGRVNIDRRSLRRRPLTTTPAAAPGRPAR